MKSALWDLGYDAMELVAQGDSLHATPDETDVIGDPAAAAWKRESAELFRRSHCDS